VALQAGLAGVEAGLYATSIIAGAVDSTDSTGYGEIEQQVVGEYVVKVDKREDHDSTAVVFSAYDKSNKLVRNLIYHIGFDKEDAKKIKKYFKMDETEKKKFIRERFLAVANFDFGPDVETETAAESPEPKKKSNVSDADIKTFSTGFAPR